MKYTLTVQSDDPAEITTLLSRAMAVPGAIGQIVTTDDDDESAPVANVQPGQLDSRGFPWDARIHSKNKSFNKDGSWRRAKGVSDAAVAAAEAEHRGANPTPATFPAQTVVTQPAPAPVFQQPQFSPQPAPAPGMVQQFQVPQPAPAPVQYAQPQPDFAQYAQPAPQATGPDFPQLMNALQRGSQTNGQDGQPLINPQYIGNLAARVGQMIGRTLASIMDVQNDVAGINAAMQILHADGKLV